MDNLSNEELVANNSEQTLDEFARRMYNPKLMALRTQNPFFEIAQFPDQTMSVQMQAGQIVDINIPTGAKMMRFTAGNVAATENFVVSRKGNPQAPSNVPDYDSGTIVNPVDRFFYCEELSSVTLRHVGVSGIIVTVEFFVQL